MPVEFSGAVQLHKIVEGLAFANCVFGCATEGPMMCSEFSVSGGASITLNYPADAFLVTLEGQFGVEDRDKPGEIKKLLPGEIAHVKQGTVVTWTSESSGKGFCVIQIAPEVPFEPFVLDTKPGSA